MPAVRDESLESLRQEKSRLRARGLALRRNLPDHDGRSGRAIERLTNLPEYQAATRLGIYVGTRFEVQTLPLIRSAWTAGKRTAIPCCIGDELSLFWIENRGDLAPRTLGILEPTTDVRAMNERRADVTSLELILVPGVVFDQSGGRIGHGKGYYDRLLRNVPAETPIVALAFHCQLVTPDVPMLDDDVFVDVIVTETEVCRPTGR